VAESVILNKYRHHGTIFSAFRKVGPIMAGGLHTEAATSKVLLDIEYRRNQRHYIRKQLVGEVTGQMGKR
jgi:hypothetical protein